MSDAPFILSERYRVKDPAAPGDCPGCHVGRMRSRRQDASMVGGVLHLVCDLPGCGQEVLMPMRQVAAPKAGHGLAVRREPVAEMAS